MTAFIFPGCILNSPLVLFVCDQSSPVLCTVYFGDYFGGCLGSVIISTWLAIRLLTFKCLALVLYLCTIGTLHVIPSYGYDSGGCTSVSYGVTWGSVWGGFIFLRPGVIVIFDFLFTLLHGAVSGGTIVAGCCVIPL